MSDPLMTGGTCVSCSCVRGEGTRDQALFGNFGSAGFSMAGRSHWLREEERTHDKKRHASLWIFQVAPTDSSREIWLFLEQPRSAGSGVSLPTAQFHPCAICVCQRLQSPCFASLNPEVNPTSGTERRAALSTQQCLPFLHLYSWRAVRMSLSTVQTEAGKDETGIECECG